MENVNINMPLPDAKPVCPVAGLGAFSVVSDEQVASFGGKDRLPILFASPHSGMLYPEKMVCDLQVPLIDLRRTEDAYVEDLFGDAPRFGGQLVHANYARGYVDLNRDARELDPNMFVDGPPRTVAVASPRVEAGLGCLPRVAVKGEPIYAKRLSKAEGEYRLASVHDAYHGYLRATLDAFREAHGLAVLIDCHSMPSKQIGRRKLADVVLGDRFGSSCDNRLTSLAERIFRDMGYSVARNAPYAGGYTTRYYGRPKRGIHALQIELSRALYMDETRVMKNAGFAALKANISQFSHELGKFVRRLEAEL